MSREVNKTAKQLYKAMGALKAKKEGYDAPATIVRIDGATAWVHLPGGVDETPVRMTINAKVGDTVQVRVSGGKGWITGNASAPPTDDTAANAVFNELQAYKIEVDKAVIKKADVKVLSAITANLGNVICGGTGNVNGSITIKDASGNIIGTWDKDGIDTIKGEIGGFTINSRQIRSDVTVNNTKYSAIVQSMDSSSTDLTNFAFAVVEYANGSSTATGLPFRVRYDGSLIATKGTIGGWTIGEDSLSWGGGWKSASTAGAYIGVNGFSVTGKDFYLIGTGNTSSNLYLGIGSTYNAGVISVESGYLSLEGVGGIGLLSPTTVYSTLSTTGALTVGDSITAATRVYIGTTSDNAGRAVEVRNGIFDISLNAGYSSPQSSSNAGIYDHTFSKWIIRTNYSGDIYVNGVKQVSASATPSTNSTYISSGTVDVRRYGSVVNLHLAVAFKQTASSTTTNILSAALDAQYRPKQEVYFRDSSNTVILRITTGGLVNAMASISESSTVRYFDITYLAND